jgi:outer membrane protein OmpA-like peptidoglycan-associated protein/tetratricopeptide (TPR) repeat protein
MKKQTIKVLALLAIAGSMATGCQLLKDVEYECTPDPLEMHGDSVRVSVEITFPEKGIKKKAAAEITPMLGSTALKPIRVQGEKATGNGEAIQYKAGGKVTYEDMVAYTPDMEATDLMITGKIYKGEKEKGEIEATKIADATIITPYLVNKDFKVILAQDEFRRVTQETLLTVINFDKGRSVVKASEMKDDDVKALEAFMADAQTNPKVEITGINIVGFASPEGEVDKNDGLSDDRATAGMESTMKIAKKAENEGGQKEESYKTSGSGEDFPGFERELEADTKMNESDKQLVLRILQTEKDPATREQKMRDLGKSFTYLDKNIFPMLRRAEINTNYDLTGFSDEELKANSVSSPDSLDVEELLFCATLYDDLNEKLRVYKIAEERFPDDYRTSNNVGAVLYMMNKVSEAKTKFEKANGVMDNPISKNNLGAVAGVEGDREKSMDLLNQAGGAGSEVDYNKGVLDIQNGDYSDAVSHLGSDASFNKALAQLLNGDAAGCISTIDASADASTAQGYYLKAVASARMDKLDGIVSNLKSAIAADGAYKAKAMKDREFIKYMENAAFTAIVK